MTPFGAKLFMLLGGILLVPILVGMVRGIGRLIRGESIAFIILIYVAPFIAVVLIAAGLFLMRALYSLV